MNKYVSNLISTEWDDATFSKLWPGWDAALKETGTDIKSIGKLKALKLSLSGCFISICTL